MARFPFLPPSRSSAGKRGRAKGTVVTDSDSRQKSVIITVRAPIGTRELIDQAAAVVGQNRTEFMLESARRRAEDVLLDQTIFVLDEEKHAAFMSIVDQPPRPKEELRRLLRMRAPWEK
jgi:uncharacterized protein (DUF1778 family)